MDGVPRLTHDLSHMVFNVSEVGRLMTLSAIPVLPGDGAELDLVGAVRLSPLKRGMAIDSVVDVCTFYIPHRHIYGDDWIQFIEQGWDESVNLATETTGASSVPVAQVGSGRTKSNMLLPLFYPEGYRQIWNNYYRPPTTVSVRSDAMSLWTGVERSFGWPVANLKSFWTALLANNVTSSDYNVPVVGGNVSLLDFDKQRGYLRTEQEREFFNIRYRDIVTAAGGRTTIDADDRPQLVLRSTFWASGYDVDGTSEVSLGQFSGRVTQSFRHRVPRFFCGEHGVLWTVACLRFPVVHEEETHYFATNPNPTYAQISGDPEIVGSQPPYGLSTRDVFAASTDATVRGYVPFGQWYRYQPSVVHPNFDNLDGFPFMWNVPNNTNDMVLVQPDDYDDVFQTQQLGHFQVHARMNAPIQRRLPSASTSLMMGR